MEALCNWDHPKPQKALIRQQRRFRTLPGDEAAGSCYNPTDMADILALLIEERDRLNEAIAALGGPRRRGRRPGGGAPKEAVEKPPKKKRRWRSPMSGEQREAASKRMKAYWAKRRRAAKKQEAEG